MTSVRDESVEKQANHQSEPGLRHGSSHSALMNGEELISVVL
jgi:hypothetical protein